MLVSAGLLVLVISAALLPNLGLVAAQSTCMYGTCPASTSYTPYYAALAVLAIVAVGLGLLLLMRRRGGGGSPGPLTEAEPATGAPGGPSGPSAGDAADMAVGAGAVGATVAASPTVPPGAGGAEYLEGPEDVGAGLPAAAAAAGAGAAAGTAAAQGGNEDIDSLMQELDKISGEILKRPPGKKDGAPSSDAAADEGTSSG
jgi:hypothetical protein